MYRIFLFAVLVLMLAGLVCIFCWRIGPLQLTAEAQLENFRVMTEDGFLHARWDAVAATNLNEICVTVTDDGGNVLAKENCGAQATSFQFRTGEHGEPYTVSVCMVLTDGTRTQSVSDRKLFLRYNRMPDIPFFCLRTNDGADPAFRLVSAPEGCWGISITDNEYCAAQMTVTDARKNVFFDLVQIRVRGNTSAAREKLSYKLVLSTAADLLDLQGTQYAHTEWNLLPATELDFMVGTETALLCGMEWQPGYRLINFMLNGNYLGIYWVTESVEVAPNRCRIDPSGFLIEQDAYWWNDVEKYFKAEGQQQELAFTFQYPKESQVSSERIDAIRQYINTATALLKKGDPQYAQYFDIETWSAWLLMHDILGTWDSGGSNMYYYKYDYDPSDLLSSKWKMGPAWDFDTIYEQVDLWSGARIFKHTYFPELLQQPDFCEAYLTRWEELSETLVQTMDERLWVRLEKDEGAICQSLAMESRLERTERDLYVELAAVHEWFASRVNWINGQLYS